MLGLGVRCIGLNRFILSSYYSLEVVVEQVTDALLPYYGPIARGWLSNTLHADPEVWGLLVRNPYVDVRPYFLSTSHDGRTIRVRLNLMGYGKKFARRVVDLLGSRVEGNLGGVECRVKRISYEERNIVVSQLGREIEVEFLTPTALMSDGRRRLAPTLADVIAALVRGCNKFAKYYMKKCYPIRVCDSTRRADAEVLSLDIKPFMWKHRIRMGRTIPQSGITGRMKVCATKMTAEMRKVLSLSQVIQVGRWVSYGFGKIEVRSIDN
ncbi:MAG: CRISPR system precrRNA processing endoribonuclease RAMP protein Cas6 [Thermoplasmata archaeon]